MFHMMHIIGIQLMKASKLFPSMIRLQVNNEWQDPSLVIVTYSFCFEHQSYIKRIDHTIQALKLESRIQNKGQKNRKKWQIIPMKIFKQNPDIQAHDCVSSAFNYQKSSEYQWWLVKLTRKHITYMHTNTHSYIQIYNIFICIILIAKQQRRKKKFA